MIGSKLGFKVTIHMSRDARQWKKDMLRSKGCSVVEYDEDYSTAVREGRERAKDDPRCHFVDDENSRTLFLGYAVSALRLKEQFLEKGIVVDADHPLLVYLPCGVGGGPGGVAFGIKLNFGDNAHCFFSEPTHAPSMLLGMATGLYDKVCVQDFGIDNRTEADGLAVGRASSFVGQLMTPFISGCATVSDEKLQRFLRGVYETEGIFLEPSALAGFVVPELLFSSNTGNDWIHKELGNTTLQANHIVWATGGSMVPLPDRQQYLG
jgi:D-serine dehydratase